MRAENSKSNSHQDSDDNEQTNSPNHVVTDQELIRFLLRLISNGVNDNPSSEDKKENQSDSDNEESSPPDPSYEPDESPNISASQSMNYAAARNFAIPEETFKAKFDDSVFMEHYSKVGTRRPPLSEWVEGLYKIVPSLKSEIQMCIEISKDDDEAAVRIWTSSRDITKPINLALMMDAYNTFDLKEIDVKYIKSELKKMKLDYKEVIENSIKFIRRVNTVLIDVWTVKNTKERTVYRGVPAKLFPNVKEGDEFRIVNFWWTSSNIDEAKKFSNYSGSGEGNTYLELTIPKFCFNAGIISCYSMFETEEETLIPPYTCCKLVSKVGDKMYLRVAQDNLHASFDKYSF
jgi:hypothetical protein